MISLVLIIINLLVSFAILYIQLNPGASKEISKKMPSMPEIEPKPELKHAAKQNYKGSLFKVSSLGKEEASSGSVSNKGQFREKEEKKSGSSPASGGASGNSVTRSNALVGFEKVGTPRDSTDRSVLRGALHDNVHPGLHLREEAYGGGMAMSSSLKARPEDHSDSDTSSASGQSFLGSGLIDVELNRDALQ